MVDRNACKMVYEDAEEEYDDFYDYSALDDDAEGAGLQLLSLCLACVDEDRMKARKD